MLQSLPAFLGHGELVVEHLEGVKSAGARVAPPVFTFGCQNYGSSGARVPGAGGVGSAAPSPLMGIAPRIPAPQPLAPFREGLLVFWGKTRRFERYSGSNGHSSVLATF